VFRGPERAFVRDDLGGDPNGCAVVGDIDEHDRVRADAGVSNTARSYGSASTGAMR
jgi:hypothetical protein